MSMFTLGRVRSLTEARSVRLYHSRAWVAFAASVFIFSTASPAWGFDEAAKSAALQHYKTAKGNYEQHKYLEAAKGFDLALDEVPLPVIALWAARSYQLAGDLDASQGRYVGTQISEALVQHLRQRRSFRTVSLGKRNGSAFYLSGTLRRFYVAQMSTSVSPATGVLFGAVGAAIAAASTPDVTPGTVSIEIIDWTLYDRTGKVVAKLPDVAYQRELPLPAAADCLVAYSNANEQLKQVFAEYAYTIEAAVADAAVTARDAPLDGVRREAVSASAPVEEPEAATNEPPHGSPPGESW